MFRNQFFRERSNRIRNFSNIFQKRTLNPKIPFLAIIPIIGIIYYFKKNSKDGDSVKNPRNMDSLHSFIKTHSNSNSFPSTNIFCHEALDFCGKDKFGIFTRESIRSSTVLLKIPLNLCLFNPSPIKLLKKMKRENGEWKEYFSSLPLLEHLDSPLVFGEEEKKLLGGNSSEIGRALSAKISSLQKMAQDFPQFSLRDILWADSLIISRTFSIPTEKNLILQKIKPKMFQQNPDLKNEEKNFILAPVIDMANHSFRNSNATWEIVDDFIQLTATKDIIPSGPGNSAEITINYGYHPPTAMFLMHGFVDEPPTPKSLYKIPVVFSKTTDDSSPQTFQYLVSIYGNGLIKEDAEWQKIETQMIDPSVLEIFGSNWSKNGEKKLSDFPGYEVVRLRSVVGVLEGLKAYNRELEEVINLAEKGHWTHSNRKEEALKCLDEEWKLVGKARNYLDGEMEALFEGKVVTQYLKEMQSQSESVGVN